MKWRDDGTVDRQKARTVAKGFTQVLGEDYDKTYASVAQLESVRLVCAIAVSKRLRLWQIDFVLAFPNSESMFDIYMEQPREFEEEGDDLVWKLWKTLYGTMQGAHDWAKNLDRTFEGYGYYRLWADPQIQSRITENELTLTLTWTDDILRASSTLEGKTLAKEQLRSSYEIKDIEEAKLILDMKISQSKNGDVVIS